MYVLALSVQINTKWSLQRPPHVYVISYPGYVGVELFLCSILYYPFFLKQRPQVVLHKLPPGAQHLVVVWVLCALLSYQHVLKRWKIHIKINSVDILSPRRIQQRREMNLLIQLRLILRPVGRNILIRANFMLRGRQELVMQAHPEIQADPVVLDILILVIQSLNERKNRAGTESAMSNF